jgi:hypothetical protein
MQGGFHIDAYGNSRNLLVEQNYLSGIRGMGMEFQGTAENLKFFDNYFENPNLSTDPNQNNNSIAFSLILDKSRNIEIRRNTVVALNRPDGIGCRLGFELGGDNGIFEDNYINGPRYTAYNSDGVGTTSTIVRNNKYLNYQMKDYIAFPGAGRTYTSTNNGPNVNLTWNINRPKPGIGAKRYGGSSSTPTNTTPASTPAPAPSNTGGAKYISDMTFNAVQNGWGQVERDRSNGEQASGDGKTLKLNGVSYSKGLGLHANSEVRLRLDGNYTQFLADIGLDDEVANSGSASFEVWADGVRLYNSGTMTGASATKNVAVDVRGKRELVLKVNGGSDGISHDHADWAAARLIPSNLV